MTYVVLLGVVVVQALVIEGWHRVLGVPGRAGGVVVAAAAAIGADLLVLAADGRTPLGPVPAVLGVAMVAAVVQQLLRRDGRGHLNASLAATVSVVVLAAVTPGYLAALDLEDGVALVVTVACAAGLAAVVPVVGARAGLPGWAQLVLGPGLAVPLGVVAGTAGPLGILDATLLAVVSAAVATAGSALVARAPKPRRTVAVGSSFATAAPLAYVLGKVLVG